MAKIPPRLAVFATAALLGAAAYSAAVAGNDQASVEHRHVQLGSCRVGDAVRERGELGLDLCLKARAGAELTHFFANAEDNFWEKFARGYIGLNATTWLSLHAAGIYRESEPLGRVATASRTAEPDYAVIRLGNPAFQSLRLTAGRTRLPFGVDSSQAMESLRRFENREFWASPRYGSYLTVDDRQSTTIEIGYATDEWNGDNAQLRADDPTYRPNRAYALRASRDISILDGSRLMASAAAEQSGQRRFGAAFLTATAQGDETHFEFVRILTTPTGKEAPFRQLIRAAYVSTWRADARWIVQIDDEQQRFRMGILNYDHLIVSHVLIRSAVAYIKWEDASERRRWSLSTGLEAQL